MAIRAINGRTFVDLSASSNTGQQDNKLISGQVSHQSDPPPTTTSKGSRPETNYQDGQHDPALAASAMPGYQAFYDSRAQLMEQAQDPALKAHFQAERDLVKQMMNDAQHTSNGTPSPNGTGPSDGTETPVGTEPQPPLVHPTVSKAQP